ncbi:Lin1244/Lin1753 domain-containing protein [Paenibacillus antarcticus]|uniref:Lin1244/Lin1753 domain-containing protein n=1 Tax=Paenibacillus antarcticus TaxID=253703 RepID=UPI0009FC2D52|nr:Lin1244/Lin1753 domain-containing protein [Paenibacillus antarcticus]
MARPLKESLDYFPLDIDFDQDDKMIVTLAKYGMEGLGIIVKLMGEVYRSGYFYPWTEREHYVFSNRVNVDINLVKDIVNECIKWRFFNQSVFETHGVLTSKGFQRRYIEAAKRRKSITFIDDYLLVDPTEECKNVSYSITVVNVNGNVVNVYINPDKCNGQSTQTPQSKVKESKVKEIEIDSKENQTQEPIGGVPEIPFNPYRIFEQEGFGTISSTLKDNIDDLVETYGDRWYLEAMKTAVLSGKRSMAYVNGILTRWKTVGIDEPWTKEKEAPPSKNNYRGNQKAIIPITDGKDAPAVSDDEYDRLMQEAAELQASKEREHD